ncbi:MAG: hypothetical protein R6W97_00755 [Thiobacillus sp.]
MMEPKDQQNTITWETLNQCIGAIFEVMEGRRDFSTYDVAEMLKMHGVKVINAPEELIRTH